MATPTSARRAPIEPLSRRRKAAVIVQLLLGDGGKLPLSGLPEATQEALALEMASIRLVDRDTVHAVATEFADLLDAVGLSASGSADATLAALSDHLSPDLTRKMRMKMGLSEAADPWPTVQALEPDRLCAILQSESDAVGAIILSKLPVSLAASLLGKLGGDKARSLTLAISQTEDTPPAVVQQIGKILLEGEGAASQTAFEKPPTDRIGAILNNSPAGQRDALLGDIENFDETFANDVRRAIFTFTHIPERLKPVDVPNALRAVDQEVLTTAIAAARAAGSDTAAAADFILANLSQRMATNLREEAEERGTVKPDAAEAAFNTVAAAIKDQADAGDLIFLDSEEDAKAKA